MLRSGLSAALLGSESHLEPLCFHLLCFLVVLSLERTRLPPCVVMLARRHATTHSLFFSLKSKGSGSRKAVVTRMTGLGGYGAHPPLLNLCLIASALVHGRRLGPHGYRSRQYIPQVRLRLSATYTCLLQLLTHELGREQSRRLPNNSHV